jgi:NHL repeat
MKKTKLAEIHRISAFVPIFLILVLVIAAVSNVISAMTSYAASSYTLIRQWGSGGIGNGQFNLPWSLALDSSNNVYVIDRNNERIQKFDNDGNFITTWSPGQFLQPVGIAIDSSNNVFVTAISNGANIVSKFTNNGTFIKSWLVASPNPNVDTQNAIRVDSSNNVYVSSNDRIFKFTSDGTFIKKWGSEGSGDGQFNQIVGIATDSSNNVYVTDKYNLRVEKFTSDGGFIKTWGANCQSERVFCSEPQGIATDSSNNVYVTEYNAGRVSKFTSDGGFVTGWDAPSAYGVAVDPLGSVYISSGTNVIQVYALPSTPPDTIITSAIDGNGVTVANDSSTLSTTIHIAFKGIGNNIVDFQCSLDGTKFSSCSSPFTANNLQAGMQHNFEVRAVDSFGNKDATPAVFSWFILTPKQGIEQLTQIVKGMGLSHGVETSLIAPLDAALKTLTHNNPNSQTTSCNQLNAFINQVHQKSQNGQLTSDQALQLINAARAIEVALGC